MNTILLVDDEEAIISNLAPFFERSGYCVLTAANGQEALQRLKVEKVDAVILDVLMPLLDGRAVLRQLRQAGNWTPVILLTQVGESTERALALEEGADDYLNKPFDPHELLARLRAVQRRARPGQPSIASTWQLVADELKIDRRARRVWLHEQPLILTPKAYALLEYLLLHPDELLTRERLLDAVWGWDYPTGTRTVDTRIAELRRMLQDDPEQPRFIETLPGEGYRFIAPVRPLP